MSVCPLRPRFVLLDWQLPRAARDQFLPDPSHTDSQVHMEPRIIKILGSCQSPVCIPKVALGWVLVSSSRSPARRDSAAKGRGVRQGPSEEA